MFKYPALKLNIAGVVVSINCRTAQLIKRLGYLYRGFVSDDLETVFLSINLVDHAFTSDILYPGLLRNENILNFEAGTCTGAIDIENHKADITVSSIRPVDDIDYFLRLIIAIFCFQTGGILVHGAGIVRANRAYVFFGHSGSGKTTVAQMSSNAIILNDDLVAIMPFAHEWRVYATPFGTMPNHTPDYFGHRLFAMARLIKDALNYLESMSPSIAVAELIGSTPIVSDTKGFSNEVLGRCQVLVADIPVYYLHFLPDASFWDVIIKAGY